MEHEVNSLEEEIEAEWLILHEEKAPLYAKLMRECEAIERVFVGYEVKILGWTGDVYEFFEGVAKSIARDHQSKLSIYFMVDRYVLAVTQERTRRPEDTDFNHVYFEWHYVDNDSVWQLHRCKFASSYGRSIIDRDKDIYTFADSTRQLGDTGDSHIPMGMIKSIAAMMVAQDYLFRRDWSTVDQKRVEAQDTFTPIMVAQEAVQTASQTVSS